VRYRRVEVAVPSPLTSCCLYRYAGMGNRHDTIPSANDDDLKFHRLTDLGLADFYAGAGRSSANHIGTRLHR
jgi:hypothetical protein